MHTSRSSTNCTTISANPWRYNRKLKAITKITISSRKFTISIISLPEEHYARTPGPEQQPPPPPVSCSCLGVPIPRVASGLILDMSQKKISRADELAALLFNDDSSDSEAAVDKDDSSYLELAVDRDDPSDPEDFTQEGLKAKEVALSISKSIVSLVSSVDGKLLFACTGTVVDHVGSSTWILTSATLVRKPGSDYVAYQGGDIKIEVLLHNKITIEGCIAMCSLLYNIAVVTIESQLDLPTVNLCDLPGCYFMLIRPVIVVGRDSKSKSLLVRHGEMIRESSKLDCDELLVCTCPVSKVLN